MSDLLGEELDSPACLCIQPVAMCFAKTMQEDVIGKGGAFQQAFQIIMDIFFDATAKSNQ